MALEVIDEGTLRRLVYTTAADGTVDRETLAGLYEALAEYQEEKHLRCAFIQSQSGHFGVAPLGIMGAKFKRPKVHKAVVAAIEGKCIGEPLALLCASTSMRIAGRSAMLGFGPATEGAQSLMGDTGLGAQTWHAQAMWLTLARPELNGTDAKKCGLVGEVHEDDKVVERAAAFAKWIPKLRPIALQMDHIGTLMSRALPKDSLMFYEFLDYVFGYHYPENHEETWGLHASTKDQR